MTNETTDKFDNANNETSDSSSRNPDERELKAFIYDYAKTSLDTELARFKHLEDKASKFISLLSIMIIGYTALIKMSADVILPLADTYSWINVITIAFTSAALTISWSILFRALQLAKMPRLPLDETCISNFLTNDLASNHELLSHTCAESVKLARNSNNKKAKSLKKAYKCMIFTAWLLLISIVSLAITTFAHSGSPYMSEQDKKQAPKQTQPTPPQPNVKPTPPKPVMILDSTTGD